MKIPLRILTAPADHFPGAPFVRLTALWIQLTGTWCNLECTHCLNASGPRDPWLRPMLFVPLYVAATVLFVPGVVLTLGAGAVFGVVHGAVTVSVAATLGATAAFLIGRYLARDAVARRLETNPRFRALDEAVGQEPGRSSGSRACPRCSRSTCSTTRSGSRAFPCVISWWPRGWACSRAR